MSGLLPAVREGWEMLLGQVTDCLAPAASSVVRGTLVSLAAAAGGGGCRGAPPEPPPAAFVATSAPTRARTTTTAAPAIHQFRRRRACQVCWLARTRRRPETFPP